MGEIKIKETLSVRGLMEKGREKNAGKNEMLERKIKNK